MIGENNLMGNMVTNVCVKFNYDRLRIDKALGNFRKSNNKNKNDVSSAWEPFPGPKNARKSSVQWIELRIS